MNKQSKEQIEPLKILKAIFNYLLRIIFYIKDISKKPLSVILGFIKLFIVIVSFTASLILITFFCIIAIFKDVDINSIFAIFQTIFILVAIFVFCTIFVSFWLKMRERIQNI